MKLNPKQVQDLLGVSNHSLKYWRDLSRLPGGVDNPLHLPATPDPENRNLVWYDLDAVMAFVERNDRYRDHVLAKFAPPDVIADMSPSLPRALAQPVPQPNPVAGSQPLGLLGIAQLQGELAA